MSSSADGPLEYPGIPHKGSGLLIGGRFVPMPVAAILDDELRKHGEAEARRPVIGVGANATPSRLLRKLTSQGTSSVVPMVESTVHNLAVGVGAFVSRAGYVPATPVVVPDAATTVSVSWLTADQLRAVDATERNYHRVQLPREAFPVTLPSGSGSEMPAAPHLYVSCRGNLVDDDGLPMRLTDQRTQLKNILATSPDIRGWMGDSPESFVANSTSAAHRERVAQQWWQEARIGRQPALETLPGFLGVRTGADGRPLAPETSVTSDGLTGPWRPSPESDRSPPPERPKADRQAARRE